MKDLLKNGTGTPKAAEPATVTYHMADGTYPYKELAKDHSTFRAYTIAALIVAGYMNLTKAGNLTKGKKWSRPVAKALLQSATRTWGGFLTNDGITVDGLNKATTSLKGEEVGYSTTVERVREAIKAIQTGGPVTLGKTKMNLSVKRTIELI